MYTKLLSIGLLGFLFEFQLTSAQNIANPIINVTTALQKITNVLGDLFKDFRDKKPKYELIKDLEDLLDHFKLLTYSKEKSGQILVAGAYLKPIFTQLDESSKNLPTIQEILPLVCSEGEGKKRYFVDPKFKGNFYSSLEFCKKIKMESATVDSEDDRNNVLKYLKNISNNQAGRYWSSGSKLGNGKDWKWLSNGKSISPLVWGKGEPNDSGGSQNCLEFYVNYYESGFYDDVECHYEFPAVCQTKSKK